MINKDNKLPKCKLSGTDGNVFAIIGKVRRCLQQAGQVDRAKEFAQRAMSSGSYNATRCSACAVSSSRYVDEENHGLD
jgi:hypothetical protein